MNGFHNSFDAYCDWCDEQVKKELPTVNWGEWWDKLKEESENESNY